MARSGVLKNSICFQARAQPEGSLRPESVLMLNPRTG